MQVSTNFKNNQQTNILNPSTNISHKSKEHKKRRKKNSYTDNFIDRKKLSIESSKEIIKTQKRSPSNKVGKVSNNNTNINKSKNKKNINYHIKHQNKSKQSKKIENTKNEESPIINKRHNTNNNNSHNLNSNIILINNNNINYSNKNENTTEITNKNIVVNENRNENKDLNRNVITNGDLLYKNRFKNLLISNISTITNNISNILSNNEQSINNKTNPIPKCNPYLKSKINEYCYKNKILTNSSNDETLSKGKISTNYNNDLDINISDIKFSKTKKKENQLSQIETEKEKVKKLKYNDSFYKLSENNAVKIEDNNKSEIYNNIITNNNMTEEEIKEAINVNLDTNKNNNNKIEEINDSEYRIYEVNNINKAPQSEKNDLNLNYFSNVPEYKTRNVNDFFNANIWIENENNKDPKINLDDYINIAKEKLYKIRNNNIDENNTINRKRIKSTLHYILNKNKNETTKNSEYDLTKNKNKSNDSDNTINLKGSIIKNNKYIIKTSNRMQNFININENQKNKTSKNILRNSKMNGVPNIKTIVEEKMEVFDEEEFMQIKKRNLSTKKTNIKINLDEDFKKLKRNNIIYRKNNDIYYDNVGNKTMNGENILPPNNLKLKPILNQNIMKTILKSRVNF